MWFLWYGSTYLSSWMRRTKDLSSAQSSNWTILHVDTLTHKQMYINSEPPNQQQQQQLQPQQQRLQISPCGPCAFCRLYWRIDRLSFSSWRIKTKTPQKSICSVSNGLIPRLPIALHAMPGVEESGVSRRCSSVVLGLWWVLCCFLVI